MSDSLQLHGPGLPCLPLSSEVCPNSCPRHQCHYPTISPSIILFSLCLQSFPTPESFPMFPLWAFGGQSTWAPASAWFITTTVNAIQQDPVSAKHPDYWILLELWDEEGLLFEKPADHGICSIQKTKELCWACLQEQWLLFSSTTIAH